MQQHVLDQMACCFFVVEEMPTVWYAPVTFQMKCPFIDMFFYGESNLNLGEAHLEFSVVMKNCVHMLDSFTMM